MIDDSEDDAYLSTEFFRRENIGPKLVHAFHYKGYLEHCDDHGIDPRTSIVVLDLNLRSQRGPDLIPLIRQSRNGDQIVIGICTGSQDPADKRISFDAGAEFFIDKPLNRAALEQICEQVDRLELTSHAGEELTIRHAS